MLIVVCALALSTMGCTTELPVGHVGMIMSADGLQKQVYQPGRHFVGPLSSLLLIEKQELKAKETLSILCKDDLNFAFDLVIRTRLDADDAKSVATVLERQGANLNNRNVLTTQFLYNTYVQPAARSIARTVVAKYETTEIRENRDKIQKAINDELIKSLKGTPMEIMAVYTSNFDYPKVITDAMTLAKKSEVDIKRTEIDKTKRILAAKADREVAEERKATRVAEAESEAAYNTIVAQSVSTNYLKLREIELDLARVEADKILYANAKGVTVIKGGNGSSVMPIVQTSSAAARK